MKRPFTPMLCIVLLGCSFSKHHNKSVLAATQIIQRYPSWRSFQADETSILTSLSQLSSIDPTTIRSAFVQISDEGGMSDLETAFKLRVINRFIFNVPEWVDSRDGSHFGGWLGIPVEDGRVNEMWPLKWGNTCRMELAERNFGYFGPDFNAVGEFDWLKMRYGFRPQNR